MLMLADLHNGIYLKNKIVQFIKYNWKTVMKSKGYERIEVEKPELYLEICCLKEGITVKTNIDISIKFIDVIMNHLLFSKNVI